MPQLSQCTITETQTFPATLAPALSYLTFEGDYCKELTWYVKEAAAKEQVGHLLMPTSPLLFIWQHGKYFYSLLFFFFWLFLSPCILRALSEVSSTQTGKNIKLLSGLESEK